MSTPPGNDAAPAPLHLDAHTLAVQQLFVHHQGRLRTFVLGLCPDFAAADDVMQETFLTITRKAAEFEPGSNFQAWARRIATFKVLSLSRDRQRAAARLADDVVEALAADAPESHDETADQDELRRLRECVDRLAPAARELVRLRYFGDHLPATIAQLRAQSVNAVNVTLSRARAALRECLERGGRAAAEGLP